MPVVRIKGERPQAGRGYPRLKWKDLAKFNIIPIEGKASKHQLFSSNCEDYTSNFINQEDILSLESENGNGKLISFVDKCAATPRGTREKKYRTRRILQDRTKRVDASWGVAADSQCATQEDDKLAGASDPDDSEGSSSEGSLSYSHFRPLSGRVRMAFTVPLTRLTASQRSNYAQHATNISRKASNEECNVKSTMKSKQAHQNARGSSVYFTNNNYLSDYTNTVREEPVNHSDGTEFFRRPRHAKKESGRVASFWREIKSGGKTCISSQKLREATFIISPAPSPCLQETEQVLNEIVEMSMPRINLNFPPPPFVRPPISASKITKYRTVTDLRTPFSQKPSSNNAQVSYRNVNERNSKGLTSLVTSAHSSSSRCYPPIKCHPLPKYPTKRTRFVYYYPLLKRQSCQLKCYPTQCHLSHLTYAPHCHHLHQKASIPPPEKPFYPIDLVIQNPHAISNDNLIESLSRESYFNPSISLPHLYSFMGQRSSSGVSNLPKRSSRSPSLRGSAPASPVPSVISLGNRKAPLKTSIKNNFTPSKTNKSKLSSPNEQLVKHSSSSFHDRVLQKTSSVSPAPASHPRSKNSTNLPRFGFKSSRPTSLLTSGDSTDSVNSILSDALTNSDSFSNLLEENGNVLGETSKNYSGLNGKRDKSPCTISEASSGVTSTCINKGKITALTKHLPEPQTVSVRTIATNNKEITPTASPSPGIAKKVYSSSASKDPSSYLVMSKLSASKIPQTKSSLLKSQRTMRDFESSNKSLNTLDSGLGSSLESDKVRPSSIKKNKSKDQSEEGKSKVALDVSDAWLKDKRCTSAEKKVKNRNSFRKGSTENVPQKDQFKDTNITYGVARQKFTPYSRNRIQYHSFKTNDNSSNNRNNNLASRNVSSNGYNESSKSSTNSDSLNSSKSSIPSPKFSSLGIVRSRIELIEKSPAHDQSPENVKLGPRKTFIRPTSFGKTPIVVQSTTESNVTLSGTVCRRLEYSEGNGFMPDSAKEKTPPCSNKSSPTAQDILMVASYEVKKKILSPDVGERKRVKDSSESEKSRLETSSDSLQNCISSPNESESSFEILDSPDSAMRNFMVGMKKERENAKSKEPTLLPHSQDLPSLHELCIREQDSVPPLSLSSSMQTSVTSSMTSSRTSASDATYVLDTPRVIDSCERSTPPLSSHRGEMDQDFLIDDEISDQPGLTFGDDDLPNSVFEDQDLFADDFPPESPPAFHYEDNLCSPMDVSTKTCPGRSRHESQGTVSSLGGDDLMLDYDAEDQKSSLGPKSKSIQHKLSQKKHSALTIPGPRYEEHVSSPAASQIFDEWTSMMAHVQDQETCVSDDPVVGLSSIACSIPISTQPSNGYDLQRPRTGSADLETKKGLLFKPPRQGAVAEQEKGFSLDRTNFHYICQDVTAMKTLLFKLRRVLQVADTVNPFDLKSSHYTNLGANDGLTSDDCSSSDVLEENLDLKRQVVLLQQRLEEKDRSIHILQQQLAQALHANNQSRLMSRSLDSQTSGHYPKDPNEIDVQCEPKKAVNAATQTDRSSHRLPTVLSTVSRTESEEDGLGPTVSSEDSMKALQTYANEDLASSVPS